MENKFLTNIKSLFKSFISNKELFNRRKYSMIFPLIFLAITILSLSLPPYFSSKNIESEVIIKNFPGVDEAMQKLLSSSLGCEVKNAKLSCTEDSLPINEVVVTTENGIKYTIIANQKSIATDTTVDGTKAKDTDNLIIFLNQYIRIRYVVRDYVNEVKVNEILGDYSKFEGLNFEELSATLVNNPETADEKINNFLVDTYTSTLKTQLAVNMFSSFTSFLLLVLVTCIMLKGPYLFKRKKGFKFSECFKISLTSALPSLLISLLVYLVSGTNLTLVFGFVFTARIIFIYFRYIYIKNNIFKKIYEETQEERFNV